MRSVLSIILLTIAPYAFAAGPRVDIVIGESPSKLEERAANELAVSLKRVYDADVQLAAMAPTGAANVILIGTAGSNAHLRHLSDGLPKLSDQGHAVLSLKDDDRPVLVVVGGSPAATYWAAAELAHQWGIRSMLYGDVAPVAPPAFSLEGFDLVMEPGTEQRAWHMDFDSLIGPASWSLVNQQKLLCQLARLKFNRIVLESAGKSPADAVGTYRRITVSGDTAGRSAFGGAKFFENPDLAATADEESRQKAAENLIRGITEEARSLGMTVEVRQTTDNRQPSPSSGLLPAMDFTVKNAVLNSLQSKQQHELSVQSVGVGDADLAVFLLSRASFDAKFGGTHPVHDLVTPICGEGVSDRVLTAFELAEEATKLIAANDQALGSPVPDVVMKHYSSSELPPEWWGKARENYLNAMNEMYRANTRAREGGRSYTLYFARRFEFAFEYMNCLAAVRKAGIAKSKGDAETQIAELEKAVESMNGALNAMAAVARSQSDRGIIAILNEYGYRPLVKELEAADKAAGR